MSLAPRRPTSAGRSGRRAGFTLMELLTVIAVVAVLIFMLLPAVSQSREAARRSQCQNNLKQIGLAMHNYHSVYKIFPAGVAGTGQPPNGVGNRHELGWAVPLLPFLDRTRQWNQISRPLDADADGSPRRPYWPAMGPHTGEQNYGPWVTQAPVLLCPSDEGPPPVKGAFGQNNYAVSWGDNGAGNGDDNTFAGGPATFDRDANRGMFGSLTWRGLRDARDGTVNTLMTGEIARGGGDRAIRSRIALNVAGVGGNDPFNACLAVLDPDKPGFYDDGDPTGTAVTLAKQTRGGRYHDGRVWSTGFNTILPPNGPNCVAGDAVDAPPSIFSAGSFHPGGAQFGLVDGSVQFISETIDTGMGGAFTESGRSPYGVWGALGTRAGGESLDEF